MTPKLHETLLERGPETAPEPETAEERHARLVSVRHGIRLGAVAGGAFAVFELVWPVLHVPFFYVAVPAVLIVGIAVVLGLDERREDA
jgi:hypothetical protein